MIGKVAFVTGAAGGIGRATALAFAREGADVVVADVDRDGVHATAALIGEMGGHPVVAVCDVTRTEDVRSALGAAVGRFGGLDYAFNNAGVAQTPNKLADMTEDEWDRVITINLRSVFLCLKYEIPLLLERGGGAIVNTSSGAGVKVFGTGAAYAASKHGVVAVTKDAALDYAGVGIRINAVCPGIIDTAMAGWVFGTSPEARAQVNSREPVGRMGQADEVAAAVIYLCSDQAAFVTGHALVIDGGQTI
jgi:NAD(P)-dependent dehydrogenase (short-subunit alcohol dehydrogenase family)